MAFQNYLKTGLSLCRDRLVVRVAGREQRLHRALCNTRTLLRGNMDIADTTYSLPISTVNAIVEKKSSMKIRLSLPYFIRAGISICTVPIPRQVLHRTVFPISTYPVPKQHWHCHTSGGMSVLRYRMSGGLLSWVGFEHLGHIFY